MQDNPYASPKTGDAASEDSSVDLVLIAARENPYLKPLFKCRKYAVLAFIFLVVLAWLTTYGATIVVAIGRSLGPGVFPRMMLLLELLAGGMAIALVLATITFHILLFLAAHHHRGIIYAAGHLGIAIALLPTILFGILVVPLMIRCDVQRLVADSGAVHG